MALPRVGIQLSGQQYASPEDGVKRRSVIYDEASRAELGGSANAIAFPSGSGMFTIAQRFSPLGGQKVPLVDR